MIIIKKGKSVQQEEKYYKAECNCGCVFAFKEEDFIRIKNIGYYNIAQKAKVFPKANIYIRCPECTRTILKKKCIEITNSQYKKDLLKYGTQ